MLGFFIFIFFTYFYILFIKLQSFMNVMIGATENVEDSDKISFIDLFPNMDILCCLYFGHSHNICLTVIITLHSEHSGGGPCGLFIKCPCVNKVWPIRRRVRITCVCLSLWYDELHFPTEDFIGFNLLFIVSSFHIFCHLFTMAVFIYLI